MRVHHTRFEGVAEKKRTHIFCILSLGSVELITDVSEISVCIIRVNVLNDHISLIFIPISPIDGSSYWCTVLKEGGVKVCGRPPDSASSGVLIISYCVVLLADSSLCIYRVFMTRVCWIVLII